jgi:hypothetical protein
MWIQPERTRPGGTRCMCPDRGCQHGGLPHTPRSQTGQSWASGQPDSPCMQMNQQWQTALWSKAGKLPPCCLERTARPRTPHKLTRLPGHQKRWHCQPDKRHMQWHPAERSGQKCTASTPVSLMQVHSVQHCTARSRLDCSLVSDQPGSPCMRKSQEPQIGLTHSCHSATSWRIPRKNQHHTPRKQTHSCAASELVQCQLGKPCILWRLAESRHP